MIFSFRKPNAEKKELIITFNSNYDNNTSSTLMCQKLELLDLIKRQFNVEEKRILKYCNSFTLRATTNDFYRLTGLQTEKFSVREANIYSIPEKTERWKQQCERKNVGIKKEMRWNLENIGAYRAQVQARGYGIKVGIIDTGIDYNHPEVRGRFGNYKGYNAIKNNNDPFDDEGHGTHVAGIVAGETTGVATECMLLAYKVLDENGSGSEGDVISGIEKAIDDGVHVINMSLGSPRGSKLEHQVIRAAYENGIIIAAAAGNEGYGPSFPASFEEVVSVAAVDRKNDHADFSNIWETTAISAPGVKIYSSIPGKKYAEYSGTSMATPHVAGCCALYKSINNLNNIETLKKIEDTAEKLGKKDVYGAGLIRIDRMVGANGRKILDFLQ